MPTLPTDTLPKFKLLTDREAPGMAVMPVPVNGIDCGELGIESVMVNVAFLEPAARGENVREMVQLAFAARELPHVVADVLKSAALSPDIEVPRIDNAAVPVFDRVRTETALVLPMVIAPKERAAGPIET